MISQRKERRYYGADAQGVRGDALTVGDQSQFHLTSKFAVDLTAGRFSQMGVRPFFITIARGRCNKPWHRRQIVTFLLPRARFAATHSACSATKRASLQTLTIETGLPHPKVQPSHHQCHLLESSSNVTEHSLRSVGSAQEVVGVFQHVDR